MTIFTRTPQKIRAEAGTLLHIIFLCVNSLSIRYFHCVGGLLGARRDDDHGRDSGSAYIFKHVGTTWSQAAKLTATDGAADDYCLRLFRHSTSPESVLTSVNPCLFQLINALFLVSIRNFKFYEDCKRKGCGNANKTRIPRPNERFRTNHEYEPRRIRPILTTRLGPRKYRIP